MALIQLAQPSGRWDFKFQSGARIFGIATKNFKDYINQECRRTEEKIPRELDQTEVMAPDGNVVAWLDRGMRGRDWSTPPLLMTWRGSARATDQLTWANTTWSVTRTSQPLG